MSDIDDIANRTAAEIGLAYRTGEADPVAVAECFLSRIDATASDNIFITVTGERARKEAEASWKRFKSGSAQSPLDGVPIAWKDLFDVEGTTTTGGSALFRDAEASQCDSPIVANAAAAGMVCLGKLNLTEFAYSGLGLNPHFGTPVNPNDRTTHRSPGGSSSGSGAAVAGGLTPCAIGSDTGGSVRIPASLNGVVGFKTTEGRIPKKGMLSLSPTLDTVGPLARSVADCALLDMVLRGAIDLEARRADLRSLNIVAATNIVLDEADGAVLENYERSLDMLEQAGVSITRRKVEAIDDMTALMGRHGSLTSAEAYHDYHAIVDGKEGTSVDRRVVYRILQGKAMSANDLLSLQIGREEAIGKLTAELNGALLTMPTTAITAPEIAPLEADDDLFHKVNLRVLRNTMLGNMLRICGLAIPNGRDEDDLPTSIMFCADGGADTRLLSFGLEIERVLAPTFEPTWTRKRQ